MISTSNFAQIWMLKVLVCGLALFSVIMDSKEIDISSPSTQAILIINLRTKLMTSVHSDY